GRSPVQVKGPGGVGFFEGCSVPAAGFGHSLMRKTDGTAWAWGSNAFGQLGDGTTTMRLTPVQVLGPGGVGLLDKLSDLPFGVLAGGVAHSLALRSDWTVWSWGSNGRGQLGDGTNEQRRTPVRVRFGP